MTKLISISFLTILLVGCIHLNPRFKSESHFDGLDKKFELSSRGDSVLYCFIIHGIGHQEQYYSYEMIDELGKNLLGKDFTYEPNKSIKDSCVERKILESKNEKKKLVFYTITWSPYSDEYKSDLEDIEKKNNPNKFSISKKVKSGVMIDRAGDLFFAQHSEVLPKILKLIDMSVSDMIEHSSGASVQNLNLISGSLGSQVFMKYLKLHYANFKTDLKECLAEEENVLVSNLFSSAFIEAADSADTPENKKVIFINDFFAHSKTDSSENVSSANTKSLNFYMLTNQVNLMPDNLEAWGGVKFNCDQPEPDIRFDNTTFIAFRNPNDMLCYYLPKKVLAQQSDSILVTNIYYWNFLVRNNIIQAHTAPFSLKKMHKVLAYGSAKHKGVFKWVKVLDNK